MVKTAGSIAKQVGYRVVVKYSGRYLLERAQCRERPERPRQREYIDSSALREVRSSEWTLVEMVWHAVADEGSNNRVEVSVIQQ
jgi:hypothetical protein